MLKCCVAILSIFFCIINYIVQAEPILLKNANELIGEQTDITNQRTLLGNVILQQRNVIVNSNSAIQYINSNIFLLNGNVVITQDSLVLKSESILYDGNTYLASANQKIAITDGKKTLIGDRGIYSTNTLIAEFYDNVELEDDSLVVYANKIVYNRKTGESFASGDVIIKIKKQNIFAQADTIINFSKTDITIAKSNPVLFQIDTNKDMTLDTLTIKADSIIANRNDDIYSFYNNVEIVRKDLKAKSQEAIYNKKDEDIILFNPNPNTNIKQHSIIWLDSTQLHADSIYLKLQDNKLKTIHSYKNCISISMNDTINLNRIDQLAGDEIIIYIENDTLYKIESIENAKSVFFFKDNATNEPDGAVEATATQIIINLKDNKADEVIYIKSIPGKYHPEPFVNNKETDFYLPNFVKEDNKPLKPNIKIK